MKEISYHAPRTLREAISILSKANGNGRALAGGTDLIAQLKEGRKSATVLVDVKGIPELNRLEFRPRRGLRIGAAVPCSTIAAHPDVQESYPAVAFSCSLVGSIQIQNRASIGGNICNAAPSADTIPALICLGAKAVIAGPSGKREVPLEELFLGPGRTVLAPGELLSEVIIPTPPGSSACVYQRFTPREEMDIAVVGVGSFVVLAPNERASGGRKCKEAKIALGATAPTPVRAKEAEAFLSGRIIDDSAINEAGELAVLSAKPITDVRGSAEYRKELVKVLTRRTLKACLNALGA